MRPPEEPALVTVVVATRNRWPDLERSLPHHEGPVVLVDNGSTDGTPARVRERFPDMRVVELTENWGAVARNVGVGVAETPYVAFADDDSWWASGALTAAAAIFDAFPRLGLLAGRLLVGPGERLDPVCTEMAASPLGRDDDLPGPSVLGFLACGAVVRRTAFLEAGGFDDVVFFRGEEQRLALDLAAHSWGLAYVAEVVAHHHPSDLRDTERGQVLSARNDLLTALMRRPWPMVARTAAEVIGRGRPGRRGVLQAVPRTARALQRRRVVPPDVERARRRLDAA